MTALRIIPILLYIALATASSQAYSGGTGTAEDPYQIATAQDLIALGNEPNDYDKHFILTANIDLTGRTFGQAIIAPDGAPPFRGAFDGAGHVISGLTIYDGGAGGDYLALFGRMDGMPEVKSLGLENVSISGDEYIGGLVGYGDAAVISKSYSLGTVSGNDYVGGLCGANEKGNIDKCYTTGVVSGGLDSECVGGLVGKSVRGAISNCHSSTSVCGCTGVGGLIGRLSTGVVSNSYSSTTASGYASVGGLVGASQSGRISFCYSTGTANGENEVGGLVGDSDFGRVLSCYSTTAVHGIEHVGGLLGTIFMGSISTSYSIGSVSGDASVGGLVGYNHHCSIFQCFWDTQRCGLARSDGGVGLTTDEIMNPEMLGFNGLANDPNWVLDADRDYPRLAWEGTAGQIVPWPAFDFLEGSGTAEAPYQIETVDQLVFLSRAGALAGSHFMLLDDLDLSELLWPQAVIPYFNGTFDGNGFCIRHLRIEGEHHLGLFGYLDEDAVVSNLDLEAVDIRGADHVGGLAGASRGEVSGCCCQGKSHGRMYVGNLIGTNYFGRVASSRGAGSVAGANYVGGLLGYNYGGLIINCSSAAVTEGQASVGGLVGHTIATGRHYTHDWVPVMDYEGIHHSYSTGAIRGERAVGGLVGCNSAGAISNCYSAGPVGGEERIGGLVGYNYRGNIFRSFWDVECSGLAHSDGGVGLTTVEMMDPEMLGLNGLADDPNWVLNPYADYPRLAWEGSPGQIVSLPEIKWLDGDGTSEDPYEIAQVQQLVRFSRAGALADKHVVLTSDLDLATLSWPQAVIPYFSGHFDGNGFRIRNLRVEGDGHLGLFGYLEIGAVVRAIGLDGVDVNGVGDSVGGLVGHNDGLIEEVYSMGTVAGAEYVGGLMGQSVYGSVLNSYCGGAVMGTRYAGGIAGGQYNSGATSACYSTCVVSGDHFYIDPLVGSGVGSYNDCFWERRISDSFWQTRGIGLTTDQMMVATPYLGAGWDFVDETDNGVEDIWWMLEGDYPRLWWEVD